MNKAILHILFLVLLYSCNTKDAKNGNGAEITLQDTEKYDSLVFLVERMDTLSLEDRIRLFKNEERIILYFDENWKLISKEEASYISTIKWIEGDLFLVRDYYIDGQNQMTGIYKTLTPNVDWTDINEWNDRNAEARKVGKFVWYRNGRIDFTEFYTYTDFEKGYGSSERQNYEYRRKSRAVKPLIEKDSIN
ncbi:MAG TPA: hypothetical protein VD908_12520 [Cytophagales bacterium]|nr:hypothetical protein [Cytophagales bacterium]